MDSTAPEWREAIHAGMFLPIQLVQDDGFNVRIVIDEPLNPDEEEMWVDRWAAKLVIPDGTLTIASESIAVPSGEYRLDFLTYLPGVNGFYGMESNASGSESLAAYFRRTRPDEPFPWWLQAICMDDPREDTEHQAEWDDSEFDYDTGPAYIDFVIHLTPWEQRPPDRTPIPPPLSEDEVAYGWIPVMVHPRKPEKCPLGLVAQELTGDQEYE
ncbi:MAG: hypothetical protein OHK0029_12200 [Armatimonadaceae bacterium]